MYVCGRVPGLRLQGMAGAHRRTTTEQRRRRGGHARGRWAGVDVGLCDARRVAGAAVDGGGAAAGRRRTAGVRRAVGGAAAARRAAGGWEQDERRQRRRRCGSRQLICGASLSVTGQSSAHVAMPAAGWKSCWLHFLVHVAPNPLSLRHSLLLACMIRTAAHGVGHACMRARVDRRFCLPQAAVSLPWRASTAPTHTVLGCAPIVLLLLIPMHGHPRAAAAVHATSATCRPVRSSQEEAPRLRAGPHWAASAASGSAAGPAPMPARDLGAGAARPSTPTTLTPCPLCSPLRLRLLQRWAPRPGAWAPLQERPTSSSSMGRCRRRRGARATRRRRS